MQKNAFIQLLLLLLVVLSSSKLFAQTHQDLAIIEQTNFANSVYANKRVITYLFATKNKFIKYNPVSLVAGGMLYAYQKVLSPQLANECPYTISCSSYSKKAIRHFGLIKGIALSTDRMMRCNRLSFVDIHPLDINEKGQIIDLPEHAVLKDICE